MDSGSLETVLEHARTLIAALREATPHPTDA